MKLFITDNGDETVGIFPQTWEVECPFEQDEVELDELDFFRKGIVNSYKEFTSGVVTAYYRFEIDAINEAIQTAV